MEKGNYYLPKLATYQCTFCNSDCTRYYCQRNKLSETYNYFKLRDMLKFEDDLSEYCTMYSKASEVSQQ